MKRVTFIKSVVIGALWFVGVRPKFGLDWAEADNGQTVLIREVWNRLDDDQWLLTQYTDNGDVIFQAVEQPPFPFGNAVTSLSSEVWTVERR